MGGDQADAQGRGPLDPRDRPPHRPRPQYGSRRASLQGSAPLSARAQAEEIEEEGYGGGKTILDDYLREVRPRFRLPRTYQCTSYRPAEICQFDVWEPSREIPVGHGQTRQGFVVTCALGWSRAAAATLVFSKQGHDLRFGISRCLAFLGALPKTIVWDREGALHAGGGRPTEEFAAFCGELPVGWHFCEARDPQAKGIVERHQGFMETNFEPGRSFASPEHFQAELDGWEERVAGRLLRTIRARPPARPPARPAGRRVQFATATEWVARLGEAKRQGDLEAELRRLSFVPLLVVDEVGYIPFDPEAANLMFSLLSARYERASLIVTSNKPFSAWGEIFGDQVVAAAMIDHLVHHTEILGLKGDSYRLRDKDLGSPPPRD